MNKKFKAARNMYIQATNDSLLEEYKDSLAILEEAINKDWTIRELIEKFPKDVEIVLGNNVSGVDVAYLDTMEVEELTW